MARRFVTDRNRVASATRSPSVHRNRIYRPVSRLQPAWFSRRRGPQHVGALLAELLETLGEEPSQTAPTAPAGRDRPMRQLELFATQGAV